MKPIFVCMINPVLMGFIGAILIHFWLTPYQMLWIVSPIMLMGFIGLTFSVVTRGE